MKLSTILICLGNTSVVSPRTRYNGVRELEYYYYDSKIIGRGEAGVAQDENPACFGIKQETAKLKYGMVYMQGK